MIRIKCKHRAMSARLLVDPADQPKPPVGSDDCNPIPQTKPPDLKKPEKCPASD